ncbi:FitA-like ribbon-helix-helix domain-containing protein [Rhizobium sp. C4]|uniref:FitA-like ribbon-helix-helix domain-containing protein n=1 Tax=Rhizobium sp. C4 TaxID=1349800 RepID=UPI001E5454F0|nr:plasmid stability protein stbC [Rhizobium sp. C4]MCD2174910.1 plasmid stability protein stbC [Rhizobium sp. C4]
MATITITNLPDSVHRALQVRATASGRSLEAEISTILIWASKPEGRLKLGSLLTSIAREAGGLSENEAGRMDALRDRSPAVPLRFD